MNLLIDVGNTLIKVAVSDKGNFVFLKKTERFDLQDLDAILLQYDVTSVAIVAVGQYPEVLAAACRERFCERFLFFDNSTPVPVRNDYHTPATLGADRLLAAVAADAMFPGRDLLVVDFGSAITVDLVCRGVFLGGNISPGARLRFRSLNNFTAKLPLCNITGEASLLGKETHTAIVNGVVNGIQWEIERYISEYETLYPDLQVIFTGGDAKDFSGRIARKVTVDENLVMRGLNIVLEYNEK